MTPWSSAMLGSAARANSKRMACAADPPDPPHGRACRQWMHKIHPPQQLGVVVCPKFCRVSSIGGVGPNVGRVSSTGGAKSGFCPSTVLVRVMGEIPRLKTGASPFESTSNMVFNSLAKQPGLEGKANR